LSDRHATVLGPEPQASDVFSFEAVDVTGTYRVVADDVQRSLPAGAVAKALASQMSLPENIPWGLRDATSAFLNDEQPIGEQISPGTSVTVTPKTHLGAGFVH
jgi:hypothetical protein